MPPDLPPPEAALRPDPAPALAASFRAAGARMAGLPFVNPALAVEPVGFARWDAHWLGVLVTPWCMNLVLAPCDPRAWPAVAPGATRRFDFPAGPFDFVGARDEAAGEYLVCSLFSPMAAFADQASARAVAACARAALLDAGTAAAPDAGPLDGLDGALAAPMSRRDLLRGRRAESDRDPRR